MLHFRTTCENDVIVQVPRDVCVSSIMVEVIPNKEVIRPVVPNVVMIHRSPSQNMTCEQMDSFAFKPTGRQNLTKDSTIQLRFEPEINLDNFVVRITGECIPVTVADHPD